MATMVNFSRGNGGFWVDDEDAGWMKNYKWHRYNNGNGREYARTGDPQKGFVSAHRMIIGYYGYAVPAGSQVDHRDGNGLNDCKGNLRIASPAENSANRGPQRNNTSGYKGVTFSNGKWIAQIQVKNHYMNLGSHPTAEHAALAYNGAAKAYFGEFAYQNPVDFNMI